MQRVVFSVPWMVLALVAAASVVELAREMQQWDVPPSVMLINVILTGAVVFALGLAIEVVEEEYQAGRMKRWVGRLLFWTPRIAALSFAAFVSLFALDVLAEGSGLWETLLALLIHLIPVGIMLIGIAIAWRYEWVGAVASLAGRCGTWRPSGPFPSLCIWPWRACR